MANFRLAHLRFMLIMARMNVFAKVVGIFALAVLSSCVQGQGNYPPYNKRNNVATVHRRAPIPGAATRTSPAAGGMAPARPAAPASRPAPTPACSAVYVMDALTGRQLYAYNANVRRQVASTQKIITALCVCDSGNLDKMVTVQAAECKEPPIKLGMRPGQQYRKRDLLKAMLTSSFNDVAACLARDTAGSIPAFAARMNARAKRMGMTDSHFVNANGLPADQYSTARDMARAAFYAYRNPTIRSYINIPEYTMTKADGTVRTVRSTNKLLRLYPWVQGMKTGYTNKAGKCLISCGSANGRAVIVVILGSTSSKIWGESLKYLKWGLNIS